VTTLEGFDLLVVGGGMAGMSAAAQAADQGARVVVCEAANRLGGTALLSTGNVWTVDTEDAFHRADPDGDVRLWRTVRDGLFPSLGWLAGLDVEVGDRHRASSSSLYDPPPVGRNVDVEGFMQRAERLVERAGGWVLRRTSVARLEQQEDGAVAGAVLVDRNSADTVAVATSSAVLSTGGFQSSPEIVSRYFGPARAAALAVRSNEDSRGDGLRLGTDAGGARTDDMDRFYGVVLAAVERRLTEADFRALVLHPAVIGVAFAADGHRFVDESSGAVPLADGVARQGRAVLVLGSSMRDEAARRLGVSLEDVLGAAADSGARVAGPSDVVDLGRRVAAWGYDGPSLTASLAAYDAALESGLDLQVPRSRFRLPVGSGGVMAVEIQAAMTSTYGGLRTDVTARVLRPDGSAIPGLFAAGVDQGGYNVSGYVGGLSRALVFGRVAATTALGAPAP
jgi:succinate dehydrogenase/fumarate reductase flavoprotein subunit